MSSFIKYQRGDALSVKAICTTLTLCLLISFLFVLPCMGASPIDSSQKITDAENALSHSYVTVASAEKAGANVSVLAIDLNSAAALLNQAEDANASGNFESAISKADSSIGISNEVLGNATLLYNSASTNAKNAFWVTVAFSTVGATCFLIAAFLFWNWFSRRYNKKLLKMKVEVREC